MLNVTYSVIGELGQGITGTVCLYFLMSEAFLMSDARSEGWKDVKSKDTRLKARRGQNS